MTKYTEEDEAYMRERYMLHPTPGTIEMLAEDLNRTPRSIIGKLAKMGIYKSRGAYKPKYGETPITKEEIVFNLGQLLGIEPEDIKGLEKAQKDSLLTLEKAIQKIKEPL